MPKLVVPKKCPPWIENHTFDVWRQLGYGVLKGQKAKYVNEEGDWVFTEDQVDELPVHKGRYLDEYSLFDDSIPGDR